MKKTNKSKVLAVLKQETPLSAHYISGVTFLTERQVQKTISNLRADGYNIQKHRLNKNFITYFLVTNRIKKQPSKDKPITEIISKTKNDDQPEQKTEKDKNITRPKDIDKLVKKCYHLIKAHGSCNIADIEYNLTVSRSKAIKLLAMTSLRYPDFKLKVSDEKEG